LIFAALVCSANCGRHWGRFARLCRRIQLGRIDDFAGQSAGKRFAPLPIDAERKDSELARRRGGHRHAGTRIRGLVDRPNITGLSPSAPSALPTSPDRPIPVEVRQPDPGALQTLAALIAPLIHPLATTGIIVIFILIQKQDLRNRLVRLAGSRDLQRTTAAIDDAGQRLSRLFLTQLALNAGFGLVIGTGLWFIGVPSAPLWGMLAMILRFVPYIGPPIAAIFPLVLAAAVGTGWAMVIWTGALFLVTAQDGEVRFGCGELTR
jgi:AI-2E family transporter